MSQNIYWLVGDRFVCTYRKKFLINEISKNGVWEVIEFKADSTNAFLSVINQSSVFDVTGKYLFVHDGSLPEPSKTVSFLEKFKNREDVLIIIEGDGFSSSRPDQRTAMYKQYQDNMLYYEPVIQPNGFPNKELISKSLKILNIIIEEKCKVKPKSSFLEEIFEKMNYDFGTTVNEVEKCFICLGKMPSDINEISQFLPKNKKSMDEIVRFVLHKKYFESFDHINELMNCEEDKQNAAMLFLGTISENISFMTHCKNANDGNIESPEAVGEYVSKYFLKKDKKADPVSSGKRYQFIKNLLNNYDSRSLVIMNKIVNDAINDIKFSKHSKEHILNETIMSIFQIS